MTSGANGKPYVGYVRISSLGRREAGNNLSAEGQLKSIKATAARQGIELNPDWTFSDEDISGQTFERAGWQKVVELVESGQAGGVVVWNQARASRARSWETLSMIAAVEEAGGRIYSQAGPITVATFEGEVMAFINGAADNKFAVEQGEGLKRSVADAIDRGAHLQAPYGYRKGPRVASRAMPIEPREDEAKAVRLMYELRAEGLSWAAIARRLDELGHRPRPYVRHGEQVQGGWRPQAVRGVVTSEVYLGTAHNGAIRKTGAHKRLVEPELWARANAVKAVKPVGPRGAYTLTGLVRCTSCGRVMSHTSGSQGRDYYKCLDQGATRCPAPVNVPAGRLTEWVVDEFKEEYLGTTFGPDEADVAVTAAAGEVEAAAARLEAAAAMRVKLAAGGSARAIEIADAEVDAATAGLEEAERALAEAKAAAAGVALPPWLDAEAFDGLPAAEQNRWLSAVYAFVVVRKDPVWRGPIAGRAKLVRVVDVVGDPIVAARNR